MAPNTRSYVTTGLSQRSKNVVSGLVDLSKINTALVDNLNYSVKNKGVTTKQTIEAIAATIEGGLSTRVHCDKETYKNMYQDIFKTMNNSKTQDRINYIKYEHNEKKTTGVTKCCR